MSKKPFKTILEKYNRLKKQAGLEYVAEIHDLIEKGDKNKLMEYTKQIKDKTLQEAVVRLAKYL
jgi:hypothetical protein